ncbi:MAG TPA: flippase-like domain-containing protein [Phaeodactylibacter sp.]|nr:flippase-like domain-containing protein [Phaeodactylibacter sp.]
MKKNKTDELSEEQEEVLRSIRTSKIILPIVIGLGVVFYLMYQQFDPAEFAKIEWNQHVLFWVVLSFLLLIVRHAAYAARLRILSEGVFSWRKCVELVFIWEFSSAVSPTSIGGSAVAMVVLAQEKLAAAKTTTLVLYSAVLDTIFFVGILPLLFIFFGTNMIRPDMQTLADLDKWGYTFLGAYIFMAGYGALFFYGLFINPNTIKRFMVWFTRLSFLKKYRKSAVELGDDIIIASGEIKKKKWNFHFGAFLSTATAWSCRFLLLNCLIIAFVDTPTDFVTQSNLYARLQTMFVIMAFSPTPGGAGFAEVLFGGFLSDYVNSDTFSLIIAFIWRLFTYYLYLVVGAIIIPNWIKNVINEREMKRIMRD